ncbi:HTH_Tnp_Tc3_2 domain-containing protein [Trichonephila clavipes]|nr:HTH_Tnp_Tc3_2 domain-containing protein [Trichonephila clavipes]
MAQRKHLDDFLHGRIIGRLEGGRTQLEVSEELGIVQSVISRLRNDSKMMVINRLSTASDLSRQLLVRQFQGRPLDAFWHIGLYARRPVRYVPLIMSNITAPFCSLPGAESLNGGHHNSGLV